MQRVALVVGVSNARSLGWASAKALVRGGEFQHVIVTYQNERFKRSVDGLIKEEESNLRSKSIMSPEDPLQKMTSFSCDVSKEEEVESLFREKIPSLLSNLNTQNIEKEPTNEAEITLDAIVHSVAYAPPEAMKPVDNSDYPLLYTSLEDFNTAHSVSAHSLLTTSKHALPLLSCRASMKDRSSSITTISYLGSTRAVTNYNVMGPAKASLEACVRGLALELSPEPHNIRVNAVSAGPVNTLAARGIKNFTEMRNQSAVFSLMKRAITAEEVANTVEFLSGGKSSGITGQVLYCDGGCSAYGGGCQ